MTEETEYSYRPVSVAKEAALLAEKHSQLSEQIANLNLKGFVSASLSIVHDGIIRTSPLEEIKAASGMQLSVNQSKITSISFSIPRDEAMRLHHLHLTELRRRLIALEGRIRELGFVL